MLPKIILSSQILACSTISQSFLLSAFGFKLAKKVAKTKAWVVCIWGASLWEVFHQSCHGAIWTFSWLPSTTVIPISGFPWPAATKQGPHMVWVGKLPIGLMNGSCYPLADNLDREYLNPIFLWDSQMKLRCWQPWLISTLTLQSVFMHVGDDLKAWMCLLPIAYQSDTNDYCSREGFNVHHLKESSFIYFFSPFLTSSTLHQFSLKVCVFNVDSSKARISCNHVFVASRNPFT